ncbi:MAG: hypothetical protein JO264_02285 [Acidisphaera sp.]|nr:hypothetical protein [Acidisphaera sp.]
MAHHSKLNVWEQTWELDEAQCPCDIHLLEWIDSQAVSDAAVFHFGTGVHHLVGIENARPTRRNAVLGITASVEEYSAYESLIMERPDVHRYYTAVFGDIYLINDALLPQFDVVTLFHLCEFRTAKNDAYGAHTDLELATLLTRQTRRGGHILFYANSSAFERADSRVREVLESWERDCDVERAADFKTLIVYRKR